MPQYFLLTNNESGDEPMELGSVEVATLAMFNKVFACPWRVPTIKLQIEGPIVGDHSDVAILRDTRIPTRNNNLMFLI